MLKPLLCSCWPVFGIYVLLKSKPSLYSFITEIPIVRFSPSFVVEFILPLPNYAARKPLQAWFCRNQALWMKDELWWHHTVWFTPNIAFSVIEGGGGSKAHFSPYSKNYFSFVPNSPTCLLANASWDGISFFNSDFSLFQSTRKLAGKSPGQLYIVSHLSAMEACRFFKVAADLSLGFKVVSSNAEMLSFWRWPWIKVFQSLDGLYRRV